MAGEDGEETSSLLSPKDKVKLLCSHGGKILPRPADGHLKYVGGDTRVVAFSRDITLSELMEKLSSLFDSDVVLKYQLIPEDLDALVSVKSNEDLRHMLEEYDRQDGEGTPRLRAFLFPSTPIIIENQNASVDHHTLEQRYVDAVNGIIRTNTTAKNLSNSSACSSPKCLSPDSYSIESMINHESVLSNGYQQNSRVHLHKVQSSPSICDSNNSNTYHHHRHHNHHQQYYYYHAHHQRPQQQQPHHYGYQYTKSNDKCGGFERPATAIPMGWVDIGRSLPDHGPGHCYTTARHYRGSGGCNKYGYLDEYGVYGSGKLERTDSLPRTPMKSGWE